MSVANRIVISLLRSPLHAVLGSRLTVVRYTGGRSGSVVSLPTQYVRADDRVVIVAGRASTKRWWRNFAEPAPAELLLERRWEPVMLGVVTGDERRTAAAVYVQRFGSVEQHLAAAEVLVGRAA